MSREIAETILAQLGGGRFVAMTGATQLGFDVSALNMKLGSGTKNKATHLRIALDTLTDTYRMEFVQFSRGKVKTLPPIYGLHAEDLRRVFTEQTGFATSL